MIGGNRILMKNKAGKDINVKPERISNWTNAENNMQVAPNSVNEESKYCLSHVGYMFFFNISRKLSTDLKHKIHTSSSQV